MQLGGSQNEQNMLRRLLECFEQRIERTDGQHVYLIDDIDSVFSFCRRILHLFPDITDIFHAIIGSRIDLHYVHGGAC